MAVAGFHEFTSREELADQLAKTVASHLMTDMERGEFASVAFSGGSTPELFLERLGRRHDWVKDMTYVALVDERFVPVTDERSNERMIRQKAGLTDHPDSEFLSLFRDGTTPDQAAQIAHDKLVDDDELPFDVVTLGMGTDGHTASYFEGSKQLGLAVDPDTDHLFVAVEAPGAEEPRVTMTLPPIVSAEFVALHIEGMEKRNVYEKAMEDGPADDMPIRHILRHPNINLHVYWAP